MNSVSSTVDSLVALIPADLLAISGKVFYSGRGAFASPSDLYVLGANPGGDPVNHKTETIGGHTHTVFQTHADDWSAYRDESWEGFAPGTYGMAPRVLYLFSSLGFNPGFVPASNLIFVRSTREDQIAKQEMRSLADRCWSFHAHVIEHLKPRVILCFGKTAGNYVRKKTGSTKLLAEFVEANDRKWRSQLFGGQVGFRVVVLSHPSVADWTAKATDPTHLVREALK